MNRSIACLRSYVAAWWMKVIAVGIVLAAGNAVVLLEHTAMWEPAWRRPELVSWTRLGNDRAMLQVQGLDVDGGLLAKPTHEVRDLVRQLPDLRYCRLEMPRGLDPAAAEHALHSVAVLFEELEQLSAFQAVELEQRVAVSVLEPLRGSRAVRRLSTPLLEVPEAQQADAAFAALVDTVVSLPRLEEWCVPLDIEARLLRLDNTRLQQLQQHPSLRRLLIPPPGLTHRKASQQVCRQRLPALQLSVSHVDRGRLSAAWAILAATMCVAGLVVVSAASMLAVSAAAVVPAYAETHRRVVLGVLGVVAAVAAVCLWRVDVATVPCVLWGATAALMPAAILEWDRHRAVPGILVLPVSLAWCVAFVVPLSIIGRGWWWGWLDTFFASSLPTPTTWAMALLVGLLTVISWRALGGYAVSLANLGRTSAVITHRHAVWKQLAHQHQPGVLSRSPLWGSAPVGASVSLRLGRLASCRDAAGCRTLLAEGMITVPIGRLLVQGSIAVIVMPLVMMMTVPGFRENPQILAVAFGAIAVAAIWLRPVMLLHERSLRLPGEIGTLLPREQYLQAMRGLLDRQMILPGSLLFLGAGGLLMNHDGRWWLLLPLAALVAGLAVINVSLSELVLTFRSVVLRFVVGLAVGYATFGAGAIALNVLFSVGKPWPGGVGTKILPFVIVAVLAVGLRSWMNRRLWRFEFGRLV